MSPLHRTIHGITALVTVLLICICTVSHAGVPAPLLRDTLPSKADTSLKFPLKDRRGDEFNYPKNNNPFDLNHPSVIKDSIAYDPVTKRYYIYEKIGRSWYRKPTYLTFDEMVEYKTRQQERQYFQQRLNTTLNLNRKIQDPQLKIRESYFNRLFSNTGIPKVEIKPQGNVTLTAGYIGQNIKNPTLPERARKNGNFDFDMQANFGLNAKIGDKLNFPVTYNTLANFQFENQLKLDYTGSEDQIIKRIQAGNVSFPAKGTLMPGASTLFGLKTELQFGKLFVTTLLANQNSSAQRVQGQGGTGIQPIVIKADDYEENRHFLLGQYFRKNYNKSMARVPAVTAPVQIMRMEVWITNRTGSTTENRGVVAFMDLGENQPYNPNILSLTGSDLPQNNANNLYSKMQNDAASRDGSLVTNRLQSFGLAPAQDFERTFARKLRPEEYYFNPQIGFISLNTTLQPDEVLGVAYQYTINGKVYQVGEFSNDVTPDTTVNNSGTQKVIFLKMLKATSQRPLLPIWDLMMKNVYSVGFGQLERKDFKLNILYQEPGGGEKRYIPEGDQAGRPLLELMNLDRLNNQNDPQPDGVFDYVEGFTVISSQSRIIFPLLEPFGQDLDYIFTGPNAADLKKKYLFYPLYDSIKWVAQQSPQLNRFIMRGASRSAGGNSEISLGAFNVPQGSVNVTAGGQRLQENVDYVVDYNLGTVKIINQALVNSGVPVNVGFENNATFGNQNRNFMALRLDYRLIERQTKQLTLGAAIMRLGERPFFTKMNYGDDPIRNTMIGGDVNFRSDWKRMTKWLDALPFYSTRQTSSINLYGEAARIFPSTAKQIRPEKGGGGLIYIDDFEGTRNGIDLRFPFIAWTLASTPAHSKDRFGVPIFPEATLINQLDYGYGRAKLAWYNIEPVLQNKDEPNNPLRRDGTELSDPRVRLVRRREIFPQATPDLGQNQLITFDMAFYPTDRGPYNYDARPGSINGANGKMLNPKNRWGGIMRAIDQIDFETNNIEFIEMWVQDPFILNPSSQGGQFYFNLGNISEDILKDGRRFYENGLSTTQTQAREDTSRWARVPRNPIQIAQAFSNIPEERPQQDVGFDGFTDDQERTFRNDFLTAFRGNYGSGGSYQKLFNDPSSDDYRHFRDQLYDQNRTGLLGRYKDFNSPQGNSPIATNSQSYTPAATLYPDNEDLNRDNTLNEIEAYFQYVLDLKPKTDPAMQVGQNFIADRREEPVELTDGTKRTETWYLFRIPIRKYQLKVGNIPDFKSIRFMRMFMTGFEDSLVVRFGKLELVRNMWRTFQNSLDTTGQYKPLQNTNITSFNVTAVNVEENDKRIPVNYIIPPGIERVQQLSNNGINLLQNEQALSMQVCGLQDGDSRGVFKTLNHDLRQYKRVRMFMHAESAGKIDNLQDGNLIAVIRFGTDFINNFYEVRMPLKVTRWGSLLKDTIVWPSANQFDLDLQELVRFKLRRSGNVNTMYSENRGSGIRWSVIGNPNLGEVKGFLVSIENNKNDAVASVCAEVWINELRLSGLDEKGGFAAVGRMDLQLADLGSITVSGAMRTPGFGTIEQRVNERSRETFQQFDIAANLQLGKLLPKKAAIDIPFYASYSQTVMNPEYDPYDQDVKFNDKLKTSNNKDSIKKLAQDFVGITTVTVTNMRKNKTSNKPAKVYDISNFDVSGSYTKTERRNPLIESDVLTKYYGGLGYNYAPQPKYLEPFKKLIKYRSPWWNIIKDFNFNYRPSLLSFRADVNRQFGAARAREVVIPGVPPSPFKIPETYDKYFILDRVYNMRWDLTRSLNIDFSATNNARIDEPFGRIDTKQKKDSVRNNFLRGGRNVIYRQTANASYNFPVAKIPALDWTTARFNYATTYNWIGASRLAVNLGNTVENSQQRIFTGQLDFMRLYSKSKFLRSLETQTNKNNPPVLASPNIKFNPKDTVGKSKRYVTKLFRRLNRLEARKDKGIQYEPYPALKFVGKLFTALKTVNINYTESYNTRLPGYTDSTQYIGQNWRSRAPGLDFVFGRQPDVNWLQNAASRGLITKDSNFNFLFTQSYRQELKMEATVEPFRDFTIDINMSRSFSKNYSSLFKDTSGSGGKFANLSPLAQGGFDITFISYQTMFRKFSATEPGQSFIQFEQNRRILSQRLGIANPYTGGQINTDGYYKGYNRYAQEVLIPAFIAAYTNQDAEKVGVIDQNNRRINDNPFKRYVPKPNWRLTYNGLSRLPGLDKIFTNFTITHSYSSNLSMNNFTSALLYADQLGLGFPSFVDTVSKNFVPYFIVPNVTISERFQPLIGIDVQLTNQLNFKLDYGRSRTISLSLIDFQVSEVRSVDITVGAGWRKRGLNLPFKVPFSKGSTKQLQNDISFRFDLTYRDNAIANNILDQRNTIPTGGQKILNINPSIDYVLNNRIRLRLFLEQSRVIGYIATPPPVVNTRAGLQVNISLQ
ncbi:MAG: cell surface protein SprA [Chitinophagaceae bacterium]|nr:cell surface protein SprA [Chitinophagaceae bacterium]